MGKSVNKVILIGRLGKDPELKYTSSGTPFCRFSIATDESWNDQRTGERQTRTEWHNIVAWDKVAEVCGKYLNKGSQVYIEGKLQTREWEDDQRQKRKSTDIVCRDVVFLTPAKNGGQGGTSGTAGSARQAGDDSYPGAGTPITDEDIPF
jgi:single-strand DNA-binding protein